MSTGCRVQARGPAAWLYLWCAPRRTSPPLGCADTVRDPTAYGYHDVGVVGAVDTKVTTRADELTQRALKDQEARRRGGEKASNARTAESTVRGSCSTAWSNTRTCHDVAQCVHRVVGWNVFFGGGRHETQDTD